MRKLLVLIRGLRWKIWASAVVIVILAAGLAGWGIHRHHGATATSTPVTVTVSSGTQEQTVSATGTLEPKKTADLDFSVSGTVTHVYAKAGAHVTKGEKLAAIDPTSLVAARSAAQASYDAAVKQYDQDASDDASDVQLAADQAAVVSAKASLDSAREDAVDAVLRATINGTVTARDLSVGQVVTTGSSGGGSSSLADTSTSSSGSGSQFSLASTKAFIVDATVAATDAASLKDGMQTQVTATGVDHTIYGTVASVGQVAETSDEGAAVFPVTIDITGAQTGLYAGTSATVSIIVKQTPDVLTVTSRAIQSAKSGGTYVEEVVDGKTVKTPVKVGTVYGASTQILSGLKAGDEVEIPGFSLPAGLTSSGRSARFGGGSFPSGGFGGSFSGGSVSSGGFGGGSLPSGGLGGGQ